MSEGLASLGGLSQILSSRNVPSSFLTVPAMAPNMAPIFSSNGNGNGTGNKASDQGMFVLGNSPEETRSRAGSATSVHAVEAPVQPNSAASRRAPQRAHAAGIISVAIDAETNTLYTGSEDRTVKAWSLETKTWLFTLDGHRSSVTQLLLSRPYLFVGCADGSVRLYMLPAPAARTSAHTTSFFPCFFFK